jgi:2-methylisocitrate lyase-like PEP mutase family enzyme
MREHEKARNHAGDLRGEDTVSDQAPSTKHDVAVEAERLRRLHVPGDPLMLANIWDPATARVAEAAGMRAIATASAALAPVNGYDDHGQLPPDVAFGALRRITDAVSLPVTADLEDGYGLPAGEFVDRLFAAGACGANLEDSDHRAGGLVDADRQAERIAAIRAVARARGFDPVINARVDVHLNKGTLEDGLLRARKYLAAGADCVYPILLFDAAAIREYVAFGPTNVLYRPGSITLADLARLGVARISVGPLLFRQLLKQLERAIDAFRRLDDQGITA